MNTPTPKIIQLLMSPNDSVWQGVLLGLGDDGATYHCQGDTWQLYIPPLELQDKATEQRDEYKAALQSADNHNHEIATKLEIVTEQRDEMTLRWELTNDSLFDKRALADRLAEELKETKKHLKDANRGAEINAHALRINADKLISVTEQRDELKAKFIQQNKDLGCEMMDPNGTIWDYAKKLQTQLPTITKQRDKLADALLELRNNNSLSLGGAAYEIVEQALQSLNQDHSVDANDMIAAVKGGNHES